MPQTVLIPKFFWGKTTFIKIWGLYIVPLCEFRDMNRFFLFFPFLLKPNFSLSLPLSSTLFLSHSFTLSLLHSLIPPSLLLCILQAALCLIGVGSDRDGPICRIREEVFCVALVRFMQYYRSSKSQKDLGAQYSVVWGV